MGLFEKIFKRPSMQDIRGYFKMLSGYTPIFTTYEGGVYEMELTRAAIHAFATQCSKLKPEIRGTAYKELGKKLQFKPNSFMDTTKFLYRLATILCVQNTAFIVPIMDDTGMYITGYYPILPSMCEVVEYEKQPWLRYTFSNGQKAVIEFARVGIMTQFQYKNDFFGEDNRALYPTMQLIHTQNQGIIEGVKQSANIRFMAKLANIFKASDIAAERKRFTEENLSADNNSGVLMFDNKYADVKQIVSRPFIIDSAQVDHIKNNVYNYFGVSEKILQNTFNEDEWNAFYEGKIEPFAIQLSLVMSNMTFTEREIAFGNQIIFTANRLQYASNQSKLNIVTQLFDRGFITHNQGREIFNMAPTEDGDKYYIRKEYSEVNKLDSNNLSREGKLSLQKRNMDPDDWQDAYKEGEAHWADDLQPSVLAQQFRERLKEEGITGKLLEIGCGNGRDSIFFARAGFEVTAIDVAAAAIELAKENAEKAEVDIEFVEANAEELPFEDGKFNAVFSLSALHASDLNKSIPETARVLSAGGLMSIYIYGNTESANGEVEVHITVDDFIDLLKESGYEILDFYTEQETEYDEAGEKHQILVALVRRKDE